MARFIKTTLLALAAALTLGRPAAATDRYVVVVNKANPVERITRAELSKLFLTRTPAWPDGAAAVPHDLSSSSATRKAFSQDVHGKPLWMIVAYWQQELASGRSRPPAVSADEQAALEAVRNNVGGVAYVGEDVALGPGVKALRLEP
jgi:ABC-type phosphate transport system substrate-binding protein